MRRVIIVCNALDDTTRLERGIGSDSPAASRKVFHLCIALRLAGVRPMILSLGRGRADGSSRYFAHTVRRVHGVPVVYAPYSSTRGLSELVSLTAPAFSLFRIGRRRRCDLAAVVFYNRELAYVPSLLVAAVRGFRRVLDLEDGEVRHSTSRFSAWASRSVQTMYDRLCTAGALLACQALEHRTRVRPVMCYYGTAEPSPSTLRWNAEAVHALLGGTLAPDTGVNLLIDAIRTIRREQPPWSRQLHIHVTGKGPSLDALMALAGDPTAPVVTIHGRTTDEEYRALIDRCEIGLALKPRGGPLADTTFPSKVIEFASASMLVVTTDISDVRAVLGEGALYIERDDPAELTDALRFAVQHRTESRAIADKGFEMSWTRCGPDTAGKAVADFIFGAAR